VGPGPSPGLVREAGEQGRAVSVAEGSVEEAPRLPGAALLFAAREARFRALASGNAAEGMLLLLAGVTAGQRAAAPRAPAAPPAHGGPPLAGLRARPDAAWRDALRAVIAAARDAAPPPEALAALGRLSRAGDAELDGLAAGVLGRGLPPADLACAPFVGAALQATFVAAAGALPAPPEGHAGPRCPACGAPPVAGVVEGVSRRRFLHCALCATAWHVPRLRCVACGDDGGLVYLHAEDVPGVKAEACERCGAYVKLLDEERRPGADAAADDAATLALDLAVAEQGFRPLGANAYLGAGLGGARHAAPRHGPC
jgi:FdhE protein